eukprot:TRINITY_DN94555_c0_g1_i1.p1 TRINITY_DN94555_c0_g1~~TRINITY_DN94555_c0_g1_i1.p1  ORF type:complete len:611 (-),score=128.25 TRINITY_DN94555_c0_g1_i1:72-1880(-)
MASKRAMLGLTARLGGRQPLRLRTLCPGAWNAAPVLRWQCAASETALAEANDTAVAWLAVRQSKLQASREALAATPTQEANDEEPDAEAKLEAPALRLESASAAEAVTEGLRLAHLGSVEAIAGMQERWQAVVARLCKLELNSSEAIMVLHCMVKMDCHDTRLLERIADRIECRYFSMELGLDHHEALDLFEHDGSFQSLVNGLPLTHKIKLILVRCTDRPCTGTLREKRRPEPEVDPKTAWKTADPVEMEEWEREQFAKGRLRIKRMRNVQARVNRMAPGKRLRATLAAQLIQLLPQADAAVLAEVSQTCAFPELRLLHGDLQDHFQEALARRVAGLDRNDVIPYALAFASALRNFDGPEAYRAWRKKMLPAILKLLKHPKRDEILDGQLFVHSRLGGVSKARFSHSQESLRAERAARLLIAVVTARQVSVDIELYDSLCSPLQAILEGWLKEAKGRQEATAPHILALETIADVLSACSACGVQGGRLPEQLAGVLLLQHGKQGRKGYEALSTCSPADLCSVAHGLSLLCDDAQEPLACLWSAAEPRLQAMRPSLALMMLNAVVRGGSEELITSPGVLAAVDELLVQKLDFDSSALGRIAS